MSKGDPDLIPPNALARVTVGFSVSDSADLQRLGLDERHAELAVGEITRAILIAGGTIVYGGRLRPSGYTQQLMNEVQRFGVARHSLTLYIALPEHLQMTPDELHEIDRQLGTWGKLVTLDAEGQPIRWQDRKLREDALSEEERSEAYSALRRHMAHNTHARILVGGRLRGFQGAMPGVIEEAMLAVERGQPLYLAGGFGGGAAAVAHRLNAGPFDWLPAGLPEGAQDPLVQENLATLEERASERGWSASSNGLTEDERALLCASHRPGEIASLCVVGLAARFGPKPKPQE